MSTTLILNLSGSNEIFCSTTRVPDGPISGFRVDSRAKAGLAVEPNPNRRMYAIPLSISVLVSNSRPKRPCLLVICECAH